MSDLRDRLGKALHLMAFHDNPRPWDEADRAIEGEALLAETSKEEWRRQADRLLADIASRVGLKIEVA